MKIAICDDERIFTDIFREKLEMTAEKCGIECTVSAFLNGAEMIQIQTFRIFTEKIYRQ